MPRYKLTLSIERELTDQMKIRAVRERRDLSDITEELYRQYLNRLEASDQEIQQSKPKQ